MTRSRAYIDHINSFAWYLTRLAAFARAENKCQRCGATDALEVHHLTYDRLGHELPEDIVVVCPPCHQAADAQRAAATVHRRVARHWEARVNGWATKRYGEDWQLYHDEQEVEDEFEEWLRDKGDY